MAETSGGLKKTSFQVTAEQMAWLQAKKQRQGLASLSSIVREALAAAMTAEQRSERMAS